MAERMPMPMAQRLMRIEAAPLSDLMLLAQWMSPAFPIGAFAFSHGVETAIAEGRVKDAGGLEAWLADLLEQGSGRSDLVFLAETYQGGEVGAVDALCAAYQPSAERLEETRQLGAAFTRIVRAVWEPQLKEALYPVAVGQAARARGLDLKATAALYAQAFVANLVSVAVRSIPLGQTEGQQVVARLQPRVEGLAAAAEDFTLSELANAGFVSDIAAMRHETLKPRIYQS